MDTYCWGVPVLRAIFIISQQGDTRCVTGERREESVLTIAGSDPSGAAGIQMDLKAFAVAGVHGCSAVTALTAQNTKRFVELHPLTPAQVRSQLEALSEDFNIRHAKTGMLYEASIAEIVADWLAEEGIRPVVDPVLRATVGASLSKADLVQVLRERLIPKAALVTPNIPEASELAEFEIRGIEGMKRAAEVIHGMGCESVLIKGGHLGGAEAIDVFYNGRFKLLRAPRLEKSVRGTGCMFSAFATALLAKGNTVLQAVETAKSYVTEAIRFSSEPGRGAAVGNPFAILHNMAERYGVMEEVHRWSSYLEELLPPSLVPEVGTNLVFALPYASGREDVCGIEGRLIRAGSRVRRAGHPVFGASKHLATVVLTAMRRDRRFRCAVNLRFSPGLVEVCRELGLKIGSFDRSREPPHSTSTMEWGTEVAIRALGFVPDVIFDEGGHGKEPMVRVLGESPSNVADKVTRIVRALKGLTEATDG